MKQYPISMILLMSFQDSNWKEIQNNCSDVIIDFEYIQKCTSKELYQTIMVLESLIERNFSDGIYNFNYLMSLRQVMEETKRFSPFYYVDGRPLDLRIYSIWYEREKKQYNMDYKEFSPEDVKTFVYKKGMKKRTH